MSGETPQPQAPPASFLGTDGKWVRARGTGGLCRHLVTKTRRVVHVTLGTGQVPPGSRLALALLGPPPLFPFFVSP